MSYVHRVIIAKASAQAMAKALASGVAGRGATDLVIVPLSATGNAPATHYISSGLIEDQFASILGDSQLTFNAAQAAGSSATLAQIQTMYSNCTIRQWEKDAQGNDIVGTNANPFSVMAELGLQPVKVAI